jgi:hypothetical protein
MKACGAHLQFPGTCPVFGQSLRVMEAAMRNAVVVLFLLTGLIAVSQDYTRKAEVGFT